MSEESPQQVKSRSKIRTEITRSVKNSTAIVDNIRDGYSASNSSIKNRKSKSYAVAENVTREEFEIGFRNFRLQVTVYIFVFVIAMLMLLFSDSFAIPCLISLYSLSWYLIYIRDIHRGRIILRKWEIRHTPLNLSWSLFFSLVKKNPKILFPLI